VFAAPSTHLHLLLAKCDFGYNLETGGLVGFWVAKVFGLENLFVFFAAGVGWSAQR
jgi:hypothetical protein